MNLKKAMKLYLILETDMIEFPLKEFITSVIKGGVTAIQIRDKFGFLQDKMNTGIMLKKMLPEDFLLCVNDHVDMAASLKIPCVHLGIKDITIEKARAIYPDSLYGYSCNTLEDVQTALDMKADYIGMGPAFPTGTKKDLRDVIGPEGIQELANAAGLPCVAIGGISKLNAHELMGRGIDGIAVSSAICASKDPYRAASELREIAEKL